MIDPEDLAGPPSGDREKGWIYGVAFAGILGSYGLFCALTGHAMVPNVSFRGMLPAKPGLLRDVEGVDAVLIGTTVMFVGAFAHFHWFWGNHRRLSRYYEIAKVAALVGIISSTAVLVFRAFR